MRFTGTTVLKIENGLITQEIGLDDGVTALSQLGLITGACRRHDPGVHGRDLRAPGHSPARTPRQCGPFSDARPGRPQGQAPPNGMALRRAVFEDPQFR